MLYSLLGALLASLSASILAVMYKYQRDSARKDLEVLIASHAQLIVNTKDFQTRVEKVVIDLKASLDRAQKELDKYAAQDPKLAGDLLDRVLSPANDSNTSTTGVPAGALASGTVSTSKPGS